MKKIFSLLCCIQLTSISYASIAAIVNEQIISTHDLNSRIEFAILSSGLENSKETKQKITEQILNVLIEEQLQLQIANKFNIKIEPNELDQAVRNIEQQNNLGPDGLRKLFRKQKLPFGIMLKHIKASLAWREYINGKYRNTINVSQQLINKKIDNRKQNIKETRYLIKEIVLKPKHAEKNDKTLVDANAIIEQLKSGVPFSILAKQFSKAPSSISGGNIGWTTESSLHAKIISIVKKLKQNEYSEPIFVDGNYHIIYLQDKLLPGQFANAKTLVSFKQVNVPIPEDFFEFEVKEIIEKTSSLAKNIKKCSTVEKYIDKKATVKTVDNIDASNLHTELKNILLQTTIGKATKPLFTGKDVIFFVLCNKYVTNPQEPSNDEIKSMIISEKLNKLSQKEIRDIKNSAHIEIR